MTGYEQLIISDVTSLPTVPFQFALVCAGLFKAKYDYMADDLLFDK